MWNNIAKYFKLGSPARKEIIVYNLFLIATLAFSSIFSESLVIIILPAVVILNILVIVYRGYSRSKDLNNFIYYLNDTDKIEQFESLLTIPEFREEIEKFRKIQKVQKQVHTQYEAVRNELLDNLSHELRTPMFNVLGFLETLQSGKVKDDETRDKFLNKAYTHANKLSELLNDMIELSSLQSAKGQIKKEKIKLFPVINEVVENYLPKAEAKSNLLKLVTDNYEVEAFINEDKIKLAVSQLLSNAIKYTDDGEIIVKISQIPSGIEISVSDTGIGIPADEVERIFERLYRTKRDRDAAKIKGSGMGLAIVKHILLAHNAQYKVVSDEGKGTKFSFILPKS